MKILITNYDMHYSKINNSLLDFIHSIDLDKHKVDLLLMETGELILDLDKRVNVIYYKDYMLMPSKFLYKYKKDHIVRDLYNQQRFAFKTKYDVAISYYGHNNYIDMVSASVKANKKIIYVQNSLTDISNSMKKVLLNKYSYFDNIVFTTKNNMDIFNNIMPELKDKTLYINNIIDSKRVIKLSKEKTTINLGKSFNIVNISNLNKENHIDTLIDIHRYLKEKGKNVKTYVIGDGELSYKLAEKIRKYNLIDSFIMLGKQANPYNILNQANLYINISSSDKFNNTLLEAAVLGIPFITNDTIVNREIVSLLPINNGKLSVIEEIPKNIIKYMKEYNNKATFDYKTYEKDTKQKIEELLFK